MYEYELPHGKRFAFTVVDDTDFATRANVEPVYRLLETVGLRTTKTIWPLAPVEPSSYDGSATAAEPDYLDFLRGLQSDGFELAMHGVTMHSSKRPRVEQGLAQFAELFGDFPNCHINHFKNLDNIYWGSSRLSSRPARAAYRMAAGTHTSLGHTEGSEYFWGDLCREHVRYVRSFTVRQTNLSSLGVPIVYRDSDRPFARNLFISTEGSELATFVDAISETNQDALERDGGICIMYTHFGAGFVDGGRVNPDFERLIRRIAAKDGWFVSASELLDHLRRDQEPPNLTTTGRWKLEARWLRERLRYGSS